MTEPPKPKSLRGGGGDSSGTRCDGTRVGRVPSIAFDSVRPDSASDWAAPAHGSTTEPATESANDERTADGSKPANVLEGVSCEGVSYDGVSKDGVSKDGDSNADGSTGCGAHGDESCDAGADSPE